MKRIRARIQGVEVEVAFDSGSVHVYHAFPVKDLLKGHGYRWNPEKRTWFCRGAIDRNLFELLEEPPEDTGGKAPAIPLDGGAFPTSLTVSQLRFQVDQVLRREMGGLVWVRGVVSSQVKHYTWASYFEFRDEEGDKRLYFSAEVRQEDLADIRRGLAGTGVAEDLASDLPLLCQCQVVMGTRGGAEVRLLIRSILPEYTRARLRSQLEMTLELLAREGLLDRQKKLERPRHLWRVGLITSEQGTSIRDVLAGLHPLERRFEILFCDARMEGERAVEAVCRALDRLEHHPQPPQVILLTRGGGSEHALAVFNHPDICRRVARCTIPVLTAIGHEKDHSAVEFCSHLTPTPSTPSGLGAWLGRTFTALFEELEQKMAVLEGLARRMRDRQEQLLVSALHLLQDRARHRLLRAQTGLTHQFRMMLEGGRAIRSVRLEALRQAVARVAGVGRVRLDQRDSEVRAIARQALAGMNRALTREERRWSVCLARWDWNRLERKGGEREQGVLSHLRGGFRLVAERLRHAGERLDDRTRILTAHDPRSILGRGYALVRSPEGRVLSSREELARQGRIHIEVSDGTSGPWIREGEE